MFFVGPIIGGIIGFIVGGFLFRSPFLGMILGAFLGSSSRGAYNVHRRGSFFGNDFGAQNKAGEVFFESIFSMLGKIASADGEISASEKRVIQQFMSQQLGMNLQSQQVALEYFNRASRDRTRSFDYWARQLYNSYNGQRAILELAYNLMQQVAAADGQISSNEREMLQTAQNIFQIGRSRERSSYGQSNSSSYGSSQQSSTRRDGGALKEAYTAMGLSSTASDEDVKKTYRKKVAEFHPDKIAAKGLPAEFTQFATEKFQEIQESYDLIKRARGF